MKVIRSRSQQQKKQNSQFLQCIASIGNNSSYTEHESRKVCVQNRVFGYGRLNGVTAVFVTWPKIHAFADGLP